ncbi:MAG: hypothetical protein JST68_02170, partial [Bacteroidetes bacterium]|nr:hypothetical protein [Bacteroidota bacterium]
EVRQDTLRSSPIGMHEIDPIRISAEIVRVYLTKSIREKTLIQLFSGLVNFFFLSGHSALGVQ